MVPPAKVTPAPEDPLNWTVPPVASKVPALAQLWVIGSRPLVMLSVADAAMIAESPSAAVWRLVAYDVDALRRDVASAIEGWDWSDGRYGHSLPLTTRRLTPFGVDGGKEFEVARNRDGHGSGS